MMTKAEFLDELLKINPKYDTDFVGRAFETGRTLHDGQLRKSGEPYFIHPIEVALILARLGMDEETIIGGLLHDVVEDTEVTYVYSLIPLPPQTGVENNSINYIGIIISIAIVLILKRRLI